jgi:mRNA interferase MazF
MALEPGDVLWADLGGGAGHEQEGWRPVVVVSAAAHVVHRHGLVTVVPCTSVARPWRSRVPLRGALRLRRPTFAMTEQVRTIDLPAARDARVASTPSAGTRSPARCGAS